MENFNIDTLDSFTRAYMECALWSSTFEDDDGNTVPMDENFNLYFLAPETRAKMIADCKKFKSECEQLLADAFYKNSVRFKNSFAAFEAQAGHDFWLTRCGHGAGFWDGDWPVNGDALTKACKAYPNIDLYIGDDGLIYA